MGCLSSGQHDTTGFGIYIFSLSKFIQSPGPVQLAAAERALAYLLQ
jgi:hypothetical protein